MNLGNLRLPARHVLLFWLAVMLCSLSRPPSSSLTHGSTWLGQDKMFLAPLSPRAVAAAASGSVLLLLPACVPRQAHMGPRIGGPLPGHCGALHPPTSASPAVDVAIQHPSSSVPLLGDVARHSRLPPVNHSEYPRADAVLVRHRKVSSGRKAQLTPSLRHPPTKLALGLVQHGIAQQLPQTEGPGRILHPHCVLPPGLRYLHAIQLA